MKERYIVADDIDRNRSWVLVQWCAANGASDFTLSLLGLEGYATPFLDRVEAALAPFRLSMQDREHLTAPTRDQLVQPTQLWHVSDETIRLLMGFLDDGLFTYPAGEWETGCLEDPVIYRRGEIILGVVSHEREGLLRLTEVEHNQIVALGIPTRENAQWI
jgi:hypothetical protein